MEFLCPGKENPHGQLKFDSWLSYKTDLWSALMRERETMKKQYLPDYSKDKSMLVDLKKFKELDAYASKQVDVKDNVKDLVSALLQKAHSDLEKVRAIWIWITHHIAYDTDYYYNNAKTSCEPADILRSGKTICAGYANLFKEMCSIAGIQCQKLAGISNGKGPKKGLKKKKRHAWNTVYLDGKWHLVDCTWGSGFVKDHKFTFKYGELYFFPCPDLYPFVEDS
uniref:Kyphoscoliosis peptidase-like isoform X5 n=1 Tax=Pogona vitticeps TaxID=103695 RepID=A0ABM5FIV3_9SAUR